MPARLAHVGRAFSAAVALSAEIAANARRVWRGRKRPRRLDAVAAERESVAIYRPRHVDYRCDHRQHYAGSKLIWRKYQAEKSASCMKIVEQAEASVERRVLLVIIEGGVTSAGIRKHHQAATRPKILKSMYPRSAYFADERGGGEEM